MKSKLMNKKVLGATAVCLVILAAAWVIGVDLQRGEAGDTSIFMEWCRLGLVRCSGF